MGRNREAQIRCAADRARNLLGQLGPLVWALHCHHGAVAPTAILLSVDPDEFLGAQSEEIRKRAIDDIKALRQGIALGDAPPLFTSEGLRATINRSIVIYAVAILEQFLDEAGKPVYQHLEGKKRWPRHFIGMCSLIEEQFTSASKPFPRYHEPAHLAQVRHVIIHNDGKVDCDFRTSIDKYSLEFRLDHGESLVWAPGCRQCPVCDWDGKPVSVAIETFILPMLRHAQEFVGAAECSMRAAVA